MKKILVVDDNGADLAVIREALAESYEVAAVSSGTEAMAYLESHVCDGILLDTRMSQMDGFEVMRGIRSKETFANVPIIFMSEENDTQTESRCLEEGAMDFLVKPFVPEVLLSRISRVLELEAVRSHLEDRLEEKIKEVDEITNKSHQDSLTGLWNRAYIENKVNEHIQSGTKGALFMIDVDNFKEVNDKYGHMEGDSTLKMFADVLNGAASDADLISRVGGDEFMMFLSGKTTKKELKKLAGEIISDICQNIKEKDYDTNMSVSIGIAQIPEDGETFDAVYNAADKALYHVKQNGKNSYHFYSEQKSAEDERTKGVVDLKYLYGIMGRGDSGVGAYQLDLNTFHHIYHFIRRFVERSRRDVQLVLFTIVSQPEVAQEEIERALEMLNQAICTSLRRSDVSTKYSRRQVLVILVDANTNNGDVVARRIIECFGRMYAGDNVAVSYEITKIEGENNRNRQDLPEACKNCVWRKNLENETR